jgi:hypothetical protein
VRIKLVGFTGDLRGLESELVEAAPVVVLVGEDGSESDAMLASGLKWDIGTLERASVGDDKYMNFLRPAVFIEPGDTVWIAGATFVKALKDMSVATDESLRLGAWQTMPGGYRWTKGARRSFAELAASIAGKVTPALHRTLFDPLEKSIGDARLLFSLFEASSKEPTMERALDRALYFHETRDLARYEWVRDQAIVIDRLFVDDESFERRFGARREWLAGNRWSEGNQIPWKSPRPAVMRSAPLNDIVSSERHLSGIFFHSDALKAIRNDR